MPIHSFRKAFVACAVVWALTLCLNAQQQGQTPQGGGGQQTPTPQPTPQPRIPAPTPVPTPSANQSLSIRGRIITDAHASYPMTEVRFETDGGQPVGFAYADSGGEFNFRSQ